MIQIVGIKKHIPWGKSSINIILSVKKKREEQIPTKKFMIYSWLQP